MTPKTRDFPDDKTAPERRKNLTDEQIRELELAGGVEGGMQAGSAGPQGDADDAPQPDREEDEPARTHGKPRH